MTEKKVVLIIAGDLGFMCWLGLTLGAAGFDALPAKKVSDAKRLIREFDLHIDVLVIDPQLEGAGKFAETMQRAPHHARTIALAQRGEAEKNVGGAPFDAWKAPPVPTDPGAAGDWIQSVETQLVAVPLGSIHC